MVTGVRTLSLRSYRNATAKLTSSSICKLFHRRRHNRDECRMNSTVQQIMYQNGRSSFVFENISSSSTSLLHTLNSNWGTARFNSGTYPDTSSTGLS